MQWSHLVMCASALIASSILIEGGSVGARVVARSISGPSDMTSVRVAMTENNTLDVIVASPSGVRAPGVTNAPAVRFHVVDGGRYEIDTGPGCAGPWTPVGVAASVATPLASPVGSDLLTLCVAGTLSSDLPGSIEGTYNSLVQARTVDIVPLETYVADVVTAESPHYWATLGAAGPQGHPWGFQELEAQAVAVRSYVLSDPSGWGGYADICDLACQVYRGQTSWSPQGEAATIDTRGEVLALPTGGIARTSYSASSGGWSAPGSSFNPVQDTGDAICLTPPPVGFARAAVCNPNHDWSRVITLSSIGAQWPTTGSSPTVTIVAGDGVGTWSGRVVTISLAGDATTTTISGAAFASAFTLPSTYFTVSSETTSQVSIDGHGFGHGYGMGQWGALGYAIGADGTHSETTYQGILAHFYSPATLATLSARPALDGYLLVAADGGVFNFGDAAFFGSMGGVRLNAPIVGIAATPDGRGYWEVAADGGVFAFGDAAFFGSMGGVRLNAPVVGIAATPDGWGYWEVAADGGVFAFGDAAFFGSLGALSLNAPIDAMSLTPNGDGYYMVGADGGVFAFGDAGFYGSLSGQSTGKGALAIVCSSAAEGYLIVDARGTVSALGQIASFGSMSNVVPGYSGTIVAAAPHYAST